MIILSITLDTFSLFITIICVNVVCLQIMSYNLEILALDSGSPSLTGTTTVSIELLDVNDSPPRFLESNYTAVIQVSC